MEKSYEPKTKGEIEDKKKIVNILTKIRYSLFGYLDINTIVELNKKF